MAGPTDPAPAVPAAPGYPDEAPVSGTTFEMGDHVDPRYGTYEPTTGYTVSLSPFVMAVNETTVQEYLDFLNATGSNLYLGVSCVDLADAQCQIEEVAAGVFQAKAPELLDQPVVEVSWYGAVAYCNWRSGEDGLSPAYADTTVDPGSEGWRLPTEAEFELALRGPYGTTAVEPNYRRFWWGDDSEDHVHDFANYHGTGGTDVWEGLAPVGSFPATPWGFHDLAGNAFEWCADHWTWPWEIGGAATDPLQSGSAGFTAWRAIRGGGWNFHWAGCRNGYRGGELAVESHSYIGFRVVRRGYQSVTGGPEVVRVVPSPLLHPASPNPFNPRTTLRFELPTGVHRAELSLFDVRGRRVRTLLDGEAPERGEVVWDGRDDGGSEVASGSYFAVPVSYTHLTLPTKRIV